MAGVRSLLAGIAFVVSMSCDAAQYGNDSAADARPILADGTTYTDQMTPTSTEAWFAFRVDPYQSYSVEVWSPFGRSQDAGNAVGIWAVLESDGLSPIFTSDRSFDFPSPQIDIGFTQGERRTFVNMQSARRLVVRVIKTGNAPAAPREFAIRIVPTTLVATRWSVNGYNDVIALTNAGAANEFSGALAGSILYFNEAGGLVGSDNFTLGANASQQITKKNGVAIGGATRGGVRIVHDGAPGAVLAQQTWFNPVTGQFVAYPFAPLVHAYGRGSL